ncbi:unnamed protein product [Protopolystoma xenopodis]|uniref:Uncharacterized protein n=1 Tax=Protopolystoma xenopodis TaxID=117903 RepID=A0A3S5ADI5_9PLAT|nr:unnamed protein product [Protopolystoma xenopodis]
MPPIPMLSVPLPTSFSCLSSSEVSKSRSTSSITNRDTGQMHLGVRTVQVSPNGIHLAVGDREGNIRP